MQGPKRPRNAEEEEASDADDDIPPAPGVIVDSVALVDDDEATESDNQPEEVREPGLSRSAVEEFIIFESCGPAMG